MTSVSSDASFNGKLEGFGNLAIKSTNPVGTIPARDFAVLVTHGYSSAYFAEVAYAGAKQ